MSHSLRFFLLTNLFFIYSFLYGAMPGSLENKQPTGDSIELLNNLSQEYLDKNPEKALVYGKEALKASEKLNFKKGAARALNNLGLYYKDQGKIDKSIGYFSKSLEISKEINDTILLVQSMTCVARVLASQGITDRALEYLEEALLLSQKSNDHMATANTLNSLGALQYKLQNNDLSLLYFSRALEYREQENDSLGIAVSLNNVGVIYKANKNYRKALQYFLQSVEMLEQKGSVKNLGHVYLNLGEIYESYSDFDKALIHYNKGLKASLQVNSTLNIIEAYEYLASYYAKRRNYKKAYMNRGLFASYKDSLHQEEIAGQISDIINKFELEKKEKEYKILLSDKEIDLLNKENRIQRLELKEKKYQSYFLFIAFLLIAMIAITLFITNRGKRKLNIILREKNERNAIQNTALKKINDKLAKSEAELKALNNFKDRFFSIIGHDLKGPLNTLLGFLLILRHDIGNFTEHEFKAMTVEMERSLRGLSGLMDNLLQWSLSQMDSLNVRPEKVNIWQVVDENKALLQSGAKLKDIHIGVDIDKNIGVFADLNMIRLIFRNLMSNAIKFTPKGGEVNIYVAEREGKVKVFVADSGIGISQENQQKLFNLGKHYSIKGTENEEGTGLGLVICKEFVEMNNGNIVVESEVGQGTTFIITLPGAESNITYELQSAQFSMN